MTTGAAKKATGYAPNIETCPRCGRMWCCREHKWASMRWALGMRLRGCRLPEWVLRVTSS